jgi:MFS family permease
MPDSPGDTRSLCAGEGARHRPSRESVGGLDWLNFFIANIQTGFGPFIAVYLTVERWTQTDIGFILTVGSLVSLVGQMPGGALVDATTHKRGIAAFSVLAIAGSALALALWPVMSLVLLAELLHGAASCLFGPAVAAISLGLVGHAALGERLGRNARFASIGNGIAAALMGACGKLLSARAVFYLTALLVIPAIIALLRIRHDEIAMPRPHALARRGPAVNLKTMWNSVARNPPLLVFCLCLMAFHLANAAMLPLAGTVVTTRSANWASVLIAACIVVPQFVVAVLSPDIGRRADQWGRRPLLLIGFATLPVRGVLFAVISSPYLLVPVQILDGVAAAVLGVLMPLVVADLTRRSGRFNLALGVVGTAVGVGATLSTTAAGVVADRFGNSAAFLSLAAVGLAGVLLVYALMPETRPQGDDETGDDETGDDETGDDETGDDETGEATAISA